MISEEVLLKLNKEGFIPGPQESENDFLKRIELSKKLIENPKLFFNEHKQENIFELDDKVLKPRWNWTRAHLLNLFDVSCHDLALYYSDKGLNFFQAAATWILPINKNIKIPILQFRKVLQKKPYLFIYTLDEILAHEAVHSIRVAFNENKTEEIFSYMTATSYFRKIFGPIVRNNKEVMIFLSLIGGYFFSQMFWFTFSLSFFSFAAIFFGFATLSISLYGLIRLFFVRRVLNKSFRKLKKVLKSKKLARAVLFRLTDMEIYQISRMKKEKICEFFKKSKDLSIRFKMIYLAYFKEI